jgi:hypothetical protein
MHHFMRDISHVLPIVLALVAAIAGLYWQSSRSRTLLKRWAMQNDYALLSSQYRYLRKGPFTWTSSKNQTVYYVTVRDKQNHIRSGWVCCGGWWLGVYSDKTEVSWDEIN